MPRPASGSLGRLLRGNSGICRESVGPVFRPLASDTMINMLVQSSRRVIRASLPSSGSNCVKKLPRRCLATATRPGDGSLPLAGIKVLDMTRVLAGVCSQFILAGAHYSQRISHIAHKSWVISGMRWTTVRTNDPELGGSRTVLTLPQSRCHED